MINETRSNQDGIKKKILHMTSHLVFVNNMSFDAGTVVMHRVYIRARARAHNQTD